MDLGRIFLNHSFGSDFCVLPKRACQELKCPAWWVPDAVPSDEEAALTARWFSWLTALSGRHSEQGEEQRRHIPYLLHLLFTNQDQHKGAATLFPEVGGRKLHPSPGEVPQKGWVSLAYKLTNIKIVNTEIVQDAVYTPRKEFIVKSSHDKAISLFK